MSILDTCFPCSRSTQLNGGAVSWLLAHPRRLRSLRCKASASPRARCCFGVLDSQHSGVCNLSFTKVQWARACFSFWFCPRFLPVHRQAAVPFPPRLFLTSWLTLFFSLWSPPAYVGSGRILRASAHQRSYIEKLAMFYVAEKRKNPSWVYFSPAVHFVVFFFPPQVSLTAVESAAEPLISSQRLHFVDIINLSACQSSCPVQGCHKPTLVDVIELYAPEAACFHLFSLPFSPSYAKKHII